ncbi:hypothetical protein [Polaromonas sp. A23]|uniref:hypothetical protein n=1 Tax=Polaromonas sp. A23 TaxID=1944133 RepID=UPI0009867F2E|nr:hypothetical protein [Polaromonas sp. A23]OOG43038.1 hypothetical protein B0B52_10375 [Polaromonas sp. A23]
MQKNLLPIAFFVAFTPGLFAMTFAGAGENMTYFEHAKLSVEHCESRGFSRRADYSAWREKNEHTYRETVNAIRDEAAKRGLPKAEQELILAESIKAAKTLSQENISKRGVPCEKYGAVLQMYSDLLKR